MVDNGLAFVNTLKIMHSLDRHELVRAGVIDEGHERAWTEFRNNPFMTAMRLPDHRVELLWELIKSRQPEKYR